MTPQIGAPGKGVSRRPFLAATGGIGAASLAGCTAPTETDGRRPDHGGRKYPSEDER